jgi:glycosyltransferase involved in cell wall biosynthesis
MRILMLGWEFPPFIAGGLGVACYGLTKSLDRMGHSVLFTLPKTVDRSQGSHVKLLSPGRVDADAAAQLGGVTAELIEKLRAGETELDSVGGYDFKNAVFRGVPATFDSPYQSFEPTQTKTWFPVSGEVPLDRTMDARFHAVTGAGGPDKGAVETAGTMLASLLPQVGQGGSKAGAMYGSDLVGDSERYATLVVAMARGEDFDVIHAHDWLTYPAGVALAKVTGKPLVVHVHSTEFDRAGSNVNQRVYDIERAGMQAADQVVAVSQLTRTICVSRYGVAASKVHVVHNGVDREESQPAGDVKIESGDKLVLFLGRITMQKGPEYFIAAAKRVLEKVQNVKFVLAGSGDMAERMIELAANIGIGHKVIFTGFLRGKDVQRVFDMADCYVMPSVSEPFGIAALEAIHHDVPVILSKQSGAAEVLTHALKVDFWDIDEMANKIVAVLRHPPLSQTLREHGEFELRRLTWDGAAAKCVEVYETAIKEKGSRVARGG